MLNLLRNLRQDEYGVILSTEIVIIGSLLVIGLITGLTCLQKSVNGELLDLAGAIGALDQSYSFSAHRKSGFGNWCCAYTAGSSYVDCENGDQICGDIVGCVEHPGVLSQPCGHCGTCNNCLETAQAAPRCGLCGGQAGGCSDCRSAGPGVTSAKNSRCIETGVPRMKVTEWQGSGSSFEHPFPVIEATQTVVDPVFNQPAIQFESQPEQSVPLHEHRSLFPEAPPVAPIPQGEQLPMPIPESFPDSYQPTPPTP